MIGQVADSFRRIKSGSLLRVDGSKGIVSLDASAEAANSTRPVASPRALLQTSTRTPALRAEGFPGLEANINLLSEVAPALDLGMTGVGLYRSEFLFLARRSLPTEEEQVGTYRKLLRMLKGRSASIRTFDLRPEKLAHYSQLPASVGHPLDWRRVLDSPPVQKLFKDQVRAILRAAVEGPARILVPLVTRTEHLDFALETIADARRELDREGLEYARTVPVGIMIEVAAAALLVGNWASQVDFFALGTNDLIASALGLDREDPIGAHQSDPLHPGFLQILKQVIEAAHAGHRQVTVCGEMATDPAGTVALMALQVDSFSVAVAQLAIVRERMAGQSPKVLASFAKELLCCRTALEVKELLAQTRT
jgi:phosphoenolpyruvate-protein kinase (PTS system EI component)